MCKYCGDSAPTTFNYCPMCGKDMRGFCIEYGVRSTKKSDFIDFCEEYDLDFALDFLRRAAANSPEETLELVEMRPIATAKATLEIEYV